MFQETIQEFVDGFSNTAADTLMPAMMFLWFLGIALRTLIYYTVKREEWFAVEFDKRVRRFLDDHKQDNSTSFFVNVKKLLEKTYYELFEVRAIMKRRKSDAVSPLLDRLFLIQHGTARVVMDTLQQIRYLKHGKNHPKLLEISKNVFQNNPCFTKVFGVIPGAKFNDVLNILPGLFIVGGILGTFLGIMKALPALGNMDLNNITATKETMDTFLLKISFSMSTSIIGILLSVSMNVINTIFSPEKLFISIVDRFENSLDNLWNQSSDNRLPEDIPNFDEHRDPIEALAEDALLKEIDSRSDKPKKISRESTNLDEIVNRSTSAKDAEDKSGGQEAS